MQVQNTSEEKALLSRRHKIETFFGKLKRKIDESFPRFRAWKAASAAITVALMGINLGL
jgi:hypothetical protein